MDILFIFFFLFIFTVVICVFGSFLVVYSFLIYIYIAANLFTFLKVFSIILPLIFSVAFFTLMERKVLGALQRRRGPNVVGMWGAGQAFADAGKLLFKETIIPGSSNFIIFVLAPIITFILSLMCWSVIPVGTALIANLNVGVLFIFAISSLSVHGIVMAGWSSNSRYAFLGSLRAAAQMIAYEVTLVLTVMPVFIAAASLNLVEIVYAQMYVWYIIPFFPAFIMFFIAALAETNRSPFDLPEAESELVSGYNVDYSAITFALFFLAEYANILLMSVLITIFFLGGWLPLFWGFVPYLFIWKMFPAWFWFVLKLNLCVYLFVVVRGIVPRYRYDQLMFIGWKVLLPCSLSYFFFIYVCIFVFL